MFRITEVAKHLLIINVLMFIVSATKIMDTGSLALYYFQSENFQPYQIASHFFMHANLMHIFFNMFALVMFGSVLEQVWGAKKFLFYYFFCAMGAVFLHYLAYYIDFSQMQSTINAFAKNPDYSYFSSFFRDHINMGSLTDSGRTAYHSIGDRLSTGDNSVVPQAISMMQELLNFNIDHSAMLGASGAISGILLAFGILFPEKELMLLFLPVPIKAKYFVPFLLIVDLQLGVHQFEWDNIAHYAHLGGALFGALLILYWHKFGSNL